METDATDIGAGAIYSGGAHVPPLLRVEWQGGHRAGATANAQQ